MKKILSIGLILAIAGTFTACGLFRKAEQPEPEPPSSREEARSSSAPSKPESSAPPSQPEQPSAPEPEPSAEPVSSVSPDTVMKELLQAYKDWDLETVDSHLWGSGDVERIQDHELSGTLRQIAGRMEYTVGSVRVEEDSAYVDVTITAVDTSQAASDIVAVLLKVIAQKKLTGQPLGDSSELMRSAAESIKVEKLPTFTTETTAMLDLSEDNEWKLDLNEEENQALNNALLGGVPALLQKLGEMSEQYGIDFDF